LGAILHAGAGQQLSVSFTPKDTADYTTASRTVTINVNKRTPILTVHGVSATYDGNPHPATFSITGANGDNLTGMVSLTYNGSSARPVQAGTYTVTATFPGNSDYKSVTDSSQQVVIAKAAPTLTWATPAAITYGTSLSAIQLDATASVPGSFQYTPGSGTVLHAGSDQKLSVSFTPKDTVDYTTASGTVTINVNNLTPILTVHGVSTIYDGNPHPATFSITGANGDNLTGMVSLTYNGSSAMPVQAGTYTVTATFPGNSDYSSVTDSSQQVVIAKAAPTLTWATPAAIIAGMPLGPAQLNASSSVSGTFAYSPPAGTVLGAGSGQFLSVTFTPADAINYLSATAQVSIDVTAPPAPHVIRITAGSHSKKGLTSIIVYFDQPMNSGSAESVSNYKVFGAVTKKKHTGFTKPVAIKIVRYDLSKQTATITLSKPYKGLVQVTAQSGIMGADDEWTESPFPQQVK
jgi:hypothetical protein